MPTVSGGPVKMPAELTNPKPQTLPDLSPKVARGCGAEAKSSARSEGLLVFDWSTPKASDPSCDPVIRTIESMLPSFNRLSFNRKERRIKLQSVASDVVLHIL